LTKCAEHSTIMPLYIPHFLFYFPLGYHYPGCKKEVKGKCNMKTPQLVDMLQAGLHFGHKVCRWHPKMKPFIYTERHGVHVIDLEKTQIEMEKTLVAVKKMASEGKIILFVSTKPQAKQIVEDAAKDAGMPFLVDRWVGGLLTNFSEIKKLIKKYVSLKEKQANGELEKYTKKEQVKIGKDLEKMDKTLAGLATLTKMPDVIFVPAMQREKTAVIEANKTGVTIVAVCDTNANPTKADYIIPANDDAVNAIKMVVELVGKAAKEGRLEYEKNQPVGQKEVPAKKTAEVVSEA